MMHHQTFFYYTTKFFLHTTQTFYVLPGFFFPTSFTHLQPSRQDLSAIFLIMFIREQVLFTILDEEEKKKFISSYASIIIDHSDDVAVLFIHIFLSSQIWEGWTVQIQQHSISLMQCNNAIYSVSPFFLSLETPIFPIENQTIITKSRKQSVLLNSLPYYNV